MKHSSVYLKPIAIAIPTLVVIETAYACVFGSSSAGGTTTDGKWSQYYASGEGTGTTSAGFNTGSQVGFLVVSSGRDTVGNLVPINSTIGNATSASSYSGEKNCSAWSSLRSSATVAGATRYAEIGL